MHEYYRQRMEESASNAVIVIGSILLVIGLIAFKAIFK